MPKKKTTNQADVRTFEGFPASTIRFLRSLSKNNNREWFQNNRHHYESSFLAPSLAFINAMQPVLAKSAPLLTAEAKKSGGSLMRIYRDTRFSKEKLPYKTNIGIQFRHELGRDVHSPGMYLHISPDECFLGAGMWRPPSQELRTIREFLSDQDKRWSKLLTAKPFRTSLQLYEDRLRSAPRGFPKDHPALEHLRLKSFIASLPLSTTEVQSPNLLKTTEKFLREVRPLMEFLCEALGQPY